MRHPTCGQTAKPLEASRTLEMDGTAKVLKKPNELPASYVKGNSTNASQKLNRCGSSPEPWSKGKKGVIVWLCGDGGGGKRVLPPGSSSAAAVPAPCVLRGHGVLDGSVSMRQPSKDTNNRAKIPGYQQPCQQSPTPVQYTSRIRATAPIQLPRAHATHRAHPPGGSDWPTAPQSTATAGAIPRSILAL